MSRSYKIIPELKELDSLMRCGICYDYMKNTLITSCSHNYCSYCIRKFMQYKSQCPTCFKEASEPQLRNNRLVDQFIGLFEKVCGKIEDLTYDRIQTPGTTFLKGDNEVVAGDITPQSKNNVIDIANEVADVQATTIKISVPDMFTPRRKPKKPAPVPTEPVKLVPCPVCNVDIPERNINLHLDHCLVKSKAIPPERVATEVDRRKPLPKLVYPLLQEKDLRKKLKDLGLSTLGDRKTLVNRHQRYIVLYNSECDSLNPRPVCEIVEQVTNEEKLEKRIAPIGNSLLTANTWLSVDKKTESQVIEMAQKQYLNENKNSFANLIDNIKKKKQEKDPSTSKGEEGPSGSFSKTSKVEKQESSEMTRQMSPDSSGERSSSPVICTLPHEQGIEGGENNLQSSFDLFDTTKSSPFRSSGQRNTSHQLQRQIASPAKPRPNKLGNQLQSPISPAQTKAYCFELSSPGPSRKADYISGHSSLDSFLCTPPKLEDELLLPELNCEVIVSPNRQSAAGSPPPTPRCSSPLICQFSPNLGAKFQPSDHERTPSPNDIGHELLIPDEPSPPVLRNKRRRIAMRSTMTHNEMEDDDIFKVRESPKETDLQLQPHLQDLKKQTKNWRKRKILPLEEGREMNYNIEYGNRVLGSAEEMSAEKKIFDEKYLNCVEEVIHPEETV